MRWSTLVLAVLSALVATPACADAVAEFYTGKQIRFVIRSGVGGGYDQYSRLLGKHIGKHIPGNPSVIPINMPGGGGIRAANYVAKIAPQDGTILTIVSQGLPVDQALGLNPSFQADLRDFLWVGNLSSSNQVMVTWHSSPTKTFADLMKRETTIGSTRPARSRCRCRRCSTTSSAPRSGSSSAIRTAATSTSPWSAARSKAAPPIPGRATWR